MKGLFFRKILKKFYLFFPSEKIEFKNKKDDKEEEREVKAHGKRLFQKRKRDR